MDQQYICTILYPLMLETLLSQACAAICMDFALKPQVMYITESTYTLYTLPDIKGFIRTFSYTNNMIGNQLRL